jgi:hypothetical protein
VFLNGKMIPVKTILVSRGKRSKENGGGSEFYYDLFDIL